jgi:hypothetical protein
MTAAKVGISISFLLMDRNGDGDDYPMCPLEAQGSGKMPARFETPYV